MYETSASIEVRNNSWNIHRECIRTRKFLHTVRHFTQSLCPTRSRVCHQQYLQSHSTIKFSHCHCCIYRCFTCCNRHVWSIGYNNGTLHQFTSCMRVHQFRELCKDFNDLICTLTTGCNNNDIGFCLFRNSVLKYGLTRSERTRNKSCTTFYNRIHCINNSYSCFQ